MKRHEKKDEAWAQRIIDRLKIDLWSDLQPGAPRKLDDNRLMTILKKIHDELWAPSMDPKDRDMWANRIIDKLRSELWSVTGGGPKRQPSPDELKRVDEILARLKQELWSP
ncbi:MAG: hypothetical protein Q6373_000310 [Candidatus Sigynarchaeota archaeon]